jgi:hypothetical protein
MDPIIQSGFSPIALPLVDYLSQRQTGSLVCQLRIGLSLDRCLVGLLKIFLDQDLDDL